jgi:hypothetical protein
LVGSDSFQRFSSILSLTYFLHHSLVSSRVLGFSVGGDEKGYQNGGEVVPCQGSRSE